MPLAKPLGVFDSEMGLVRFGNLLARLAAMLLMTALVWAACCWGVKAGPEAAACGDDDPCAGEGEPPSDWEEVGESNGRLVCEEL
ncbi:MAG: hypothetical protein B7Z37_30590 [Verrucomicrobia bacterium 12-59-8]|nr:MAG: hypothetical protein B7Z37_30590 [Verrucomicrobia bacterium 12-59-8]